MTPLEISLLFQIYAQPTQMAGGRIDSLCTKGLIHGESHNLAVTEKGRVYCEAILAFPLPIQIWAIPDANRD